MLDLGVHVETGDATDPRVLRNAGLHRARILICLAAQEVNVQIQHLNVTEANARGVSACPCLSPSGRSPLVQGAPMV
ncbi:MAG: hypothetical protein HC888_07675 [Candidatus Competibacteraceae bacterium]|nr:hypothetical protein [Candidatus Competibacteraceae bacterium]